MEYDLDKITAKIGRKKIINKIIKRIIVILLVLIFIINANLLYYNLKGEKTPRIFGLYFFNIISGSMKPTINENDVIVVKNENVDNIEKNDIITFKQEDRIISHRIINIEETSGRKIFQTKGDNNKLADDFNVEESEVIGKFLFRIPKIGKITRFYTK